MAVNQRQFDQLTEMGISLWQNKAVAFDQNSQITNNKEQEDNYIEQTDKSLINLTKQNIFTDILQCLGLSIGDTLYNWAETFNLFYLWSIAIAAIGLQKCVDISVSKSVMLAALPYIAVFGLWLVLA